MSNNFFLRNPELRRNSILHFRRNAPTRDKLRQAAHRDGLSLSQFLHDAALERAKRKL